MPFSAFAATASISGPASVQVGRTFQVYLNVGGGKDVDTVRFIGSYSTEYLEFQGMANGSSLPTRSPGTSGGGGSFNFGGFSLGNPISGATRAGVLTFKAKKVGETDIVLGGGTRILSNGEDQLTGTGKLHIKITEAPAPSELPPAPQIDLYSTTHPDQDHWYPSRDLVLNWKITGEAPQTVTVGFDQAPEGPAETGATKGTSANFKVPDDGVWYGHLVARYSASNVVRKDFRFQVDGTQPRPLGVSVDYTDVKPGTKNFLRFAALDDASGVSHYDLSLNGNFVTSTLEQSYPLDALTAGDYTAQVTAYDQAGNAVIGRADFHLGAPSGAAETPAQAENWSDWLLRLLLIILAAFLLFFLGYMVRERNRWKQRAEVIRSKSTKKKK